MRRTGLLRPDFTTFFCCHEHKTPSQGRNKYFTAKGDSSPPYVDFYPNHRFLPNLKKIFFFFGNHNVCRLYFSIWFSLLSTRCLMLRISYQVCFLKICITAIAETFFSDYFLNLLLQRFLKTVLFTIPSTQRLNINDWKTSTTQICYF